MLVYCPSLNLLNLFLRLPRKSEIVTQGEEGRWRKREREEVVRGQWR